MVRTKVRTQVCGLNARPRLQSIAESDTIVIADGTRKLLGNLFESPSPRLR